MKRQTGEDRYRIGLFGSVVQAWDTEKKVMLEYRRQPLMDGRFGLDISGSIQVKQGQLVDFSPPAATTGYVFGRDSHGIVLSRKANPNWKLPLSNKSKNFTNPRSPSRAVLKFRNGDLALLDPTGINKLTPQAQASRQPKKPTEFHLGGDFSP